jgi:hypothetical protein
MHDQRRAGAIVFQRVETDEGFNADLTQAELTILAQAAFKVLAYIQWR